MVLSDSITRIRRMLRDPDGLIWSSDDLITYFNDAQTELAQKTGLLVRIENHYYPPQYDNSYLYDWERDYVEGTRYQALMVNQARGDIITYPWETSYYLSTQETDDQDTHYTQPWESHYTATAETPAVPLHAKFDKMLFIAYDEERLLPISKRELATSDPYYQDREGQPTHYYRPDDYSNIFYPYPKPSSITEQETTEEEIFLDDGGIYSSDEVWLDESDTGILTDVINQVDAFVMVYTAQPNEIGATVDDIDWPDWMVKYIELGTLERAFGADTDGFIPSLMDYWKQRKELGINALKKFKRMMLIDRDYCLGGPKQLPRSRLRLPDHYPAI